MNDKNLASFGEKKNQCFDIIENMSTTCVHCSSVYPNPKKMTMQIWKSLLGKHPKDQVSHLIEIGFCSSAGVTLLQVIQEDTQAG